MRYREIDLKRWAGQAAETQQELRAMSARAQHLGYTFEVDRQVETALELPANLRRIARKIEAMTSLHIVWVDEVAHEGPGQVMGFVRSDRMGQIHLSLDLLRAVERGDRSLEDLQKVAAHEIRHLQRPLRMGLSELPTWARQVLEQRLGIRSGDLDDRMVVEGHVDGEIQAERGRTGSAYEAYEVLCIHHRLERLGQKHLNISFRQLFAANTKAAQRNYVAYLEILAGMLTTRQDEGFEG